MEIQEAIEQFYNNNNLTDRDINIDQKYLTNLERNINEWISNIPDNDTKQAFLYLLTQYEYISECKYRLDLKNLVDRLMQFLKRPEIIEEFGEITYDEIMIFTVESDIVSGGDFLRSTLRLINKFPDDNIINVFSKVNKKEKKKRLERCKVFVFLDDILGTGKTINKFFKDRINEIKLYVNNNAIYLICGLYITEKTINNFEIPSDGNAPLNNTYPLIYSLVNKNIDPIIEETSERYETVLKYEEVLNEAVHSNLTEEYTYSMGFEGCALGISFYYGTPNNTLSSFWLEIADNHPPFLRNEKKLRPYIDQLKQKKNKRNENAYKAAKYENSKYK